MGKTAADRAAIADLVVRDVSYRFNQQRVRDLQLRAALDVTPAHQGTDTNCIMVSRNAVQTGDTADINQESGCCEPECHHRNQALTAGNGLGLATMFGE